MKKAIVLVLIALLSVNFCYGLGITPVSASYEYDEGEVKNFEMKVITSGIEKETKYSVKARTYPEHGFEETAEEDERLLIPNVDISENNLSLTPGLRYPVDVSFRMPEFETPGLHGFFIEVKQEKPPTRGQMGVSARPSVLYKVKIHVPYPGKYLDLEFDAPNTEVGEPVFITIKAWNRGNESIGKVSGDVEIFDSDGELIDTVETNEKSNIDAGGTKFELWADWKPEKDIKAGIYDAKATINYDGKTTTVDGEILLGAQDVTISDYSKVLQPNKVNNFFVEVQSLWSGKINNVFADYEILSSSGNTKASARTPTASLEDWDKRDLENYIDLAGVSEGTYDAKITLHYGEKTEVEEFEVKVEESKEPIEEQPSEVEESSGINWTFVLIGVLVILLIVGQIVFFVFIKNKDDDDEDDDF